MKRIITIALMFITLFSCTITVLAEEPSVSTARVQITYPLAMTGWAIPRGVKLGTECVMTGTIGDPQLTFVVSPVYYDSYKEAVNIGALVKGTATAYTRNDHTYYTIYLDTTTLSVGEYRLWSILTDKRSGQTYYDFIDFQVIAAQTTAGWHKVGSSYYYRNNNTYITGWIQVGGQYYYLDPDGVMHSGWLVSGNDLYYLNSAGVMQTDWQKMGDDWLYFDKTSGKLAQGWKLIDGKWYFLTQQTAIGDPNAGIMKSGWIKDGTAWYYLSPNTGAMYQGWLKSGTSWYYLTKSGAMATGWAYDGSKWYYMNSAGVMQTGWINDAGKWYYLDPSTGAMLSNTTKTIGGKSYRFNAKGEWVQ